MALPSTITSTYAWSDNKNSMAGPYEWDTANRVLEQGTASASLATTAPTLIGQTGGTEQVGQSFQLTSAATIGKVLLPMNLGSTQNNYADSLTLDLRTDDGTGNAWTAMVLATATVSFRDISSCWVTFDIADTSLSASTTYWLVVYRTGASTSFSYAWYKLATASYTSGQKASKAYGTTTIVADSATDLGFILLGTTLTRTQYVFAVDKTANRLRAFVSTDQGNTWTEADPTPGAVAPNISTTAGRKSIGCGQYNQYVAVGCSGVNFVQAVMFNMDAGLWPMQASLTTTAPGVDVNAVLVPLFIKRSSDGSAIGVFQGPTETVTTARRRIKLVNAPLSTSTYDVISGTTALPATAISYDLRYVLQGSGGRIHIFWTQDDQTGLFTRTYNPDNTYGAIHKIGTTTVSNAAGYPVGIGNTYVSGGNTFVAIPIVDAGALKVATCDSALATASGNWTVTTISATAPETTNSNPCCLASDQTKLWAWAVTAGTGRYLQWADNGSGSWGILAPFRGNTAIVANGVSARMLSNALGVVYLDGTAIKYDRLAVFAPKVSNAAGATVTTVYDLGDPAGASSVDIVPDVSEAGAAITGLVEIQIEHSGDNGGWTELGHVTVDAGTIGGPLTFGPVMQYLRVTTTTTGAASSGGVAGV